MQRKILMTSMILFLIAACGTDKDTEEKEQGRTNTLVLLSLLAVRSQPACPGQAAIRYTNTSGVSQNFALHTNGTCSATVSGSAVTVASGQTSAYQCFAAGTYYSAANAACAGNTLVYTANKNYTKSYDGTSFGNTLDN